MYDDNAYPELPRVRCEAQTGQAYHNPETPVRKTLPGRDAQMNGGGG